MQRCYGRATGTLARLGDRRPGAGQRLAVDAPQAVERLILVSPAGQPLEKPIWKSSLSLLDQIVHGLYPARELAYASRRTLSAPRSALRLAHTLRALDLGPELARVRTGGIPSVVIACSTDRLTTPAG